MKYEFDTLIYYENLYNKEMEFSARLNQKCGNSIALLTAIGSAHVFNVSALLPIRCPPSYWNILVLTSWLISILYFADALLAFKSAYSGYEYRYFPIEEMSKTIDVAEERGMGENERKKVRDTLIKLYKEASIENRKSNLKKNQAHLWLNRATIYAFVTVVIVFGLHRISF